MASFWDLLFSTLLLATVFLFSNTFFLLSAILTSPSPSLSLRSSYNFFFCTSVSSPLAFLAWCWAVSSLIFLRDFSRLTRCMSLIFVWTPWCKSSSERPFSFLFWRLAAYCASLSTYLWVYGIAMKTLSKNCKDYSAVVDSTIFNLIKFITKLITSATPSSIHSHTRPTPRAKSLHPESSVGSRYSFLISPKNSALFYQ